MISSGKIHLTLHEGCHVRTSVLTILLTVDLQSDAAKEGSTLIHRLA